MKGKRHRLYVHRFGEACCALLDELAQVLQFAAELETELVSIDISAFLQEDIILYSQIPAPSFLQ